MIAAVQCLAEYFISAFEFGDGCIKAVKYTRKPLGKCNGHACDCRLLIRGFEIRDYGHEIKVT